MKRIVFSGLLTIDLQFMVDSFPEEDTKSKAKQYGIYSGGPATNAAITAAFLGSNATLLTSIGENSFAKMIEYELDKYKVHFIDIDYQRETTPPFASVITSEDNGKRTIFSYHPANNAINYSIPNLILEDTCAVMIDGFYPKLAKQLCQKAKENSIPVIFDGGSWKDYTASLLPFIDIAICSTSFMPPDCTTSKDVINYLIENNIQKIAITQGDKSILVYESGNYHEIKPPQIQAVDTLGAGDIFHGAYAYYYSHGYNFVSALRAASDIAAESCKYFGTRKWIEKMLQKIQAN